MRSWQIQEAKARLSEVIKDAHQHGPQQITLHGQPTAVVLSRADYEKLSGSHESLLSFIQRSPFAETEAGELDLSREDSLTRDINL